MGRNMERRIGKENGKENGEGEWRFFDRGRRKRNLLVHSPVFFGSEFWLEFNWADK